MTETSQVAHLQNVINELREDLGAHQKELSSKTKKLVSMENRISSMELELTQKNKALDQIEITNKMTNDHRSDEMYLQIEEYKNQLHSKELEKQEIRSNYNQLQRQYRTLKQQYDTLCYKQQHTENEYNRLDTMYKQRMETLKRMHESQIRQSHDQMEAMKQTQFLSSNKETENIKNSLKELKESHERIETDLNTQIEDLNNQMDKREKEKDQLIQELNQLSANYKQYAQSEMEILQKKLASYEAGEIEITLRIEVDDPVVSKPPPKKPAPPRPIHISRQSSKDSSIDGEHPINLSPHIQSPKSIALSLKDVKSNPELCTIWSGNQTVPMSLQHQQAQSQGSMHIQSMEDIHNDDDMDEDEDDSDDEKGDRLFPMSILTQTRSAQMTSRTENDTYKLSVNGGKLKSRRKQRSHSHIRSSKSATSIPNPLSSSSSSGARTPTLYIFRPQAATFKFNDHDEDDAKNDDKSYNAMMAKEYLKRRESLSKYTDSALNVLKNGVFQMWGSNTKAGAPKRMHKGAQTPNPVSRNRWVNGAFPGTRRGHIAGTTSNVSSISSFSELFSDNLSQRSFGSAYGSRNGTASSVRLTASDALSNKSLELQRKMLMQANTRLAENLKNEKKNLMIVKEKAHRKYKQLQIQLQAEHRHWRLKEKQMGAKIEKTSSEAKENEGVILELQKKYHALQTDYNIRLNSGDPNAFNQPGQQHGQANISNQLILTIRSLEGNNKQLITQCEKYRRELSSLKQTVLSCNDTMKQQQNQILVLNTSVAELRKLNGFGGRTSEQLLQKQIRLLKSQRRMLVQELKDIRNQNDKLKTIIVSGHPTTKTYTTK